MDKEWTTQEGQVTYLVSTARRPGYLPAGTACNVTGDGALTLMLTGYAEKHNVVSVLG